MPGIISLIGVLSSSAVFASSSASQPSSSTTSSTQTSALANKLITTAEQYLGARYAYVGDSPVKGFSCIGLVYYVYDVLNNVPVGQDLVSAYAMAPHVDRADLQPADLVFFSGTVPGMTPLWHVAIYVGNGMMIAADSVQTGVEWDNLNDAYWSAHYAGATRPLAALDGSPTSATMPGYTDGSVPATPTSAPTSTPLLPSSAPVSAPLVGGRTASPTAVLPVPLPTATAGAILVTQHNGVVVRSGPGSQYVAMWTLTAGAHMLVVEGTGRWYHVSIGSQYGWVPASAVAEAGATQGSMRSSRTAAPTPIPARSPSQTPSIPPAAGDPTATTGQRMTVIADVLKLHVAPAMSAQVIDRLTYGTVVSVLQTHGPWIRIRLGDGTTGWVARYYLSTNPPSGTGRSDSSGDGSAQQSPQPTGSGLSGFDGVVVVAESPLEVHNGPWFGSTIIAQIQSGDQVRVLSVTPGWMYVLISSGQKGWVAAQWAS